MLSFNFTFFQSRIGMVAQLTSFSNIVVIRVIFMKYVNAIDKAQLSLRLYQSEHSH